MSSTTAAPVSPFIIDPVEYLAVDIATGRYLPGDRVHCDVLAFEHGLTCAEVAEALGDAWLLGLTDGLGNTSPVVVRWSPEQSQRHLHRLMRAMAAAVDPGSDERRVLDVDVIDGERERLGATDAFALNVPADVELFLEVARALLARRASSIVDEYVGPVAILLSEASRLVHGYEFAASEGERNEIVSGIVRALLDGERAEFATLLDDYRLAVSVA